MHTLYIKYTISIAKDQINTMTLFLEVMREGYCLINDSSIYVSMSYEKGDKPNIKHLDKENRLKSALLDILITMCSKERILHKCQISQKVQISFR
jgi:hypothetical protein